MSISVFRGQLEYNSICVKLVDKKSELQATEYRAWNVKCSEIINNKGLVGIPTPKTTYCVSRANYINL